VVPQIIHAHACIAWDLHQYHITQHGQNGNCDVTQCFSSWLDGTAICSTPQQQLAVFQPGYSFPGNNFPSKPISGNVQATNLHVRKPGRWRLNSLALSTTSRGNMQHLGSHSKSISQEKKTHALSTESKRRISTWLA